MSLCELRLQVLMHRNCGGVLYTKCPKHLNLKAEDYVCTKVDVIGVDNEKLWDHISSKIKRVILIFGVSASMLITCSFSLKGLRTSSSLTEIKAVELMDARKYVNMCKSVCFYIHLSRRHLKARVRHFCPHNSTRRPTGSVDSAKCASRHDTFFCAHHDTHFCARRNTTRALTCTKFVQRSWHNPSIDLHKIVHGSAHNHAHHCLHKIVDFQYLQLSNVHS